MRFIINIILILFLLVSSMESTIPSNPKIIAHTLPQVEVVSNYYHPVESIKVVGIERSAKATVRHYYHYFEYVAERCPFDINLIAGYFNLETNYGALTSRGQPSLWARAINPVGLISHKDNKYQDGTTHSLDDGGSNKATFSSIRRSAEGYAHLFNSSRYRPCAKLKTYEQQCHCIWQKKFHTSSNWQKRVYFVYEARRALDNLQIELQSKNLSDRDSLSNKGTLYHTDPLHPGFQNQLSLR